jgi:hypothetical protein
MSSRAAAAGHVGRKEQLLGYAFLGATVVAWIVASFITQALVTPDPGGGGDDAPALEPWLLTLLCSGMFIMYLPVRGVAGLLRLRKARWAVPGKDCARNVHAC